MFNKVIMKLLDAVCRLARNKDELRRDQILLYLEQKTTEGEGKEPHGDPVDVVMCTWNSNKIHFDICLKSIKREIPVHHFIVVDRFSQDGTLDVIRKYFDPIVVFNDENLGRARMKGIDLVDTEYFAVIDADLELPVGWFKRVTSYLDNRIGAVHEQKLWIGVVVEQALDKQRSSFSRWLYGGWSYGGPKAGPIRDITKDNMSKYRGHLGNTLVKTDIVKDWKPSPFLCACEDYDLMKHIINKGYVWRMVNNYTVIHYSSKDTREYFKKVMWEAAGTRFLRLIPLKHVLYRSIKYSIVAFINSIRFRDLQIFAYIVFWRLVYLNGYLNWNKFLVLTR